METSPNNQGSISSGGGSPARDPDVAALALSIHRGLESEQALRDAICACVRALKGRGLTPEAVLIIVKAAVRQAMPSTLTSQPIEARERLTAQAVRWCVEAYFRAD
jgi:hypothetical protein